MRDNPCMSAFVGFLQQLAGAIDATAFARMCQKLAYRGQYSADFAADGLRLHQRGSSFEGETADSLHLLTIEGCTLVADARIDGRDALRDRLRAAGRRLSPDASDHALILASYLAFDVACVTHMIGDYAFVIWDARQRRLFAARDPLGKRGLYTVQTADAFAFSTDLRALRGLPGIVDDLDLRYIGDFLMLGEGFWIDRTQTPFKAIRRLDRAHTLTMQDGELTLRRFWSPPIAREPLRFRRDPEAVEAFRALFEDAVRDRLRADRVVLTLSGGMDSSTVTATAVDLIRRENLSIDFTAITSAYQRLPDPEEAYGREIAAFLEIADRHVVYAIERFRVFHPYVHVANAIRQSLVPSQWIDFQRTLATHGQIALYGYLGDLLVSDEPLAASLRRMSPAAFGRAYAALWRYFGKRPALGSGLMHWMRGNSKPPSLMAYAFPPWIDPDFERELGLHDRWDGYWERLNQLGQNTRTPYLLRLLTNYDHYSADESDALTFTPVEAVEPFADLRVIDFLFGLPPLPWFHQKYLLRRMMAGRLPASVLGRRKQILGDVTAYMLAQPENAWIDHWQPIDGIERFIVRANIPAVTGKHALIGGNQAVHVRPLTLDRWLRGERALKGTS